MYIRLLNRKYMDINNAYLDYLKNILLNSYKNHINVINI